MKKETSSANLNNLGGKSCHINLLEMQEEGERT